MKKLLIINILLLVAIAGKSQYIPQFSQLIQTLEFINPGYNASKVDPSAVLLYRNQWTGFVGAPKSYAANVNIPVNKWHAGFGANVLAETRGLINQTDAALNACVDVKLSTLSFMTFGLSAGIETKRIDMERAVYLGAPFAADEYNANHFYTAVGINLFAQNLHIGGAFHLTPLKGTYYKSNESFSLYFNSSYLFTINDDWAVKPALVYRHFAGYNDLDIGAFVLYKDFVWIGLANRINSAMIFFADFKVTDFLRVGYSYDLSVGKTSNIQYGTHEIGLEFTLPHKKTAQFQR
ncbi:MAG TPA: PorP/SprF family type IX secretion system membrane protein [Prolixibacteraceae bacterium]|nr:PorP/SprF family type IX secretion system membrane protein [Bacteroidales bacterium]HQN93719.1 PorP/SprF family type IX secretion system membrane protein [Prolixibacteraceae bacterium]